MPDADRYDAWYAESLWALLPAVYRSEDTPTFGDSGPLRELVERIGAQMAIVRRSIDRIYEDQSIESCADWVIPYIGQLVAARLIPGLDARAQRLQVAKAIYYRRRAGTLPILEEAAHDVSGWETRIVEFFRRLSRTQHLLDPPVATPPRRTPPGGWADLRNVYAVSRVQTAFDESSYTADLRRPGQTTGWQNIPHLGVFVWRLHSFPESGSDAQTLLTTPVAALPPCTSYFTFDPTGRDVPLFATVSRDDASYGAQWVSPEEWQLPAPIDTPLLQRNLSELYAHATEAGTLEPASLGVFDGSTANLISRGDLQIVPERGRFHFRAGVAVPASVRVLHHYGSAARIGAGAYDRRLTAFAPAPAPGPAKDVIGGGGTLATALSALPATVTLTIGDSLTYDAVKNVSVDHVTLGTANGKRSLVRLPAGSEWQFSGNANSSGGGATLHLEGIFVSGADVVLAGDFLEVTITCSTFDPGSAAPDPSSGAAFQTAIDGRPLSPSRLFIDGKIKTLRVQASILGPIRTRGTGEVELLEIDGSVVQMIPTLRPTPIPKRMALPPDGGTTNRRLPPPGPPVLPDGAIALATGEVRISRSTILGPAQVHRIDVSESILQGAIDVDDTQHGCVRFSAWTSGSVLPRKYASVEIGRASPLFTAIDFGQPGYVQLRRDADLGIAAGAVGPRATIREGAENGSEMGACYPEMNAIRERSLLLKLQELMPLGLVPVVVPVT
jgi:hypothetical protein